MTKTCAECGIEYSRKRGWSQATFARTRFCSAACSATGRWRGPSGDAYRLRLGAARRRWNELHPEENRQRVAKVAATRGMSFPALAADRAGRAKAAAVRRLLERCEHCGKGRAGPRSLHRHHIDGDATNNAAGNIEVLCVPCHRDRHAVMGHGMGFKRPRTA